MQMRHTTGFYLFALIIAVGSLIYGAMNFDYLLDSLSDGGPVAIMALFLIAIFVILPPILISPKPTGPATEKYIRAGKSMDVPLVLLFFILAALVIMDSF